MLLEGKPLIDIGEADIRQIVESGLEEHLQLEYKSAIYEDGERGRREFLLDVCSFANASGGLLLIGIPELRDAQGQPTGVPDAAATLGIELPNAEPLLRAYDARVMEAIEERLPLEAAAIDVGQGRRVVAIRVPNSLNKPHSVRYQGHTYFPYRRERFRSNLTVREIKEHVMRTASRLQQAENMLKQSFIPRQAIIRPHLIVGMIPLFFEDFLVDVRAESVRTAVRKFSRAAGSNVQLVPVYTFAGLERGGENYQHVVRFQRNGLLTVSQEVPLISTTGPHRVAADTVDRLLRQIVSAAGTVYEAAAIGAPYILGMVLRTSQPLTGGYSVGGWPEDSAPVLPNDFEFPYLHVYNLSETDRIIRPLCDQAHQMFGREGSPHFNAEGLWNAG